MLEKITKFATEIQQSPDFESNCERGGQADPVTLDHLAAAFLAAGSRMPEALRALYETCDGFTLRWTYKRVTHPDYLTAGQTSIPPSATLLASIQYAPHDLALFDFVSDLTQVEIGIEYGDLKLQYHCDTPAWDVLLPVNVEEYLDLLDRTRGLYPWRELLVSTSRASLDPVLRDKFFADLTLLFGTQDIDLLDRLTR